MTISATNQGLKPGVVTSSNRPANPYDGMMIYETDTNLVRIWNGTAWKTLAYSDATNGTVLQTTTGTTTTQKTHSGSTWVDTNLAASITPLSTSSKILVIANQAGIWKQSSDTSCMLRLMRDSTEISFFTTAGYTASSAYNVVGNAGVAYLDSPSTTSTVTYKTQMSAVFGFNGIGVQNSSTMSTMVLMEIAG